MVVRSNQEHEEDEKGNAKPQRDYERITTNSHILGSDTMLKLYKPKEIFTKNLYNTFTDQNLTTRTLIYAQD